MIDDLKNKLLKANLRIVSQKEIQYGIQFLIENCGYLRIYFRKNKSTTVDLSQIKPSCLEKIKHALGEEKPTFETLFCKDSDLSIQKRILENLPADPKNILPAIGSDEVGKGDVFGPVVVTAVYIGCKEYVALKDVDIKDSKSINDRKILEISKKIKNICPHAIVVFEPERLNEKKINMNRLLEQMHIDAISRVLEKRSSLIAVYDDFGAKKDRMRSIEQLTLIGFKNGERNLAVAAASIVSRAEFLNWIETRSKFYEMEIPLGASNKTIEFIRQFIKKYGLEELKKIAKLCFSNVRKFLTLEQNS
ncbi:ribonuclease HIII [Pseudothermotoga elfii]|jgi:ribonuclease HIII|nr:ribonuclease [Pseudothermotoga sp.]